MEYAYFHSQAYGGTKDNIALYRYPNLEMCELQRKNDRWWCFGYWKKILKLIFLRSLILTSFHEQRNPKAALPTSHSPFHEMERNDADKDLPIIEWEALFDNERAPMAAEGETTPHEEPHVHMSKAKEWVSGK